MANRPLVGRNAHHCRCGKPYKESFDESSCSVRERHRLLRRNCPPARRAARYWVRPSMVSSTSRPGFSARQSSSFCRSRYSASLCCSSATAALASGNAVIIKPSDLTSLTTLSSSSPHSDAAAAGLGASRYHWWLWPASSWSSILKRQYGCSSPAVLRPDGARRGGRWSALQANSGADRDFRQRSVHRDAFRSRGHAQREGPFGAFLNCQCTVVCRRRRTVLRARAGLSHLHRTTGAFYRQIRIGNGLDRVDMPGPLARNANSGALSKALMFRSHHLAAPQVLTGGAVEPRI